MSRTLEGALSLAQWLGIPYERALNMLVDGTAGTEIRAAGDTCDRCSGSLSYSGERCWCGGRGRNDRAAPGLPTAPEDFEIGPSGRLMARRALQLLDERCEP